MINEPCEDDFDLQVYSFTGGHSPSELYVVDDMDVTATETDLTILYSPRHFARNRSRNPQKSRPITYQSREIRLVAYHDIEIYSISLD